MKKNNLVKAFEERIEFMDRQYRDYYNKGESDRMSQINFEINQLRKLVGIIKGGDAE